jgi:hypothetical protein
MNNKHPTAKDVSQEQSLVVLVELPDSESARMATRPNDFAATKLA